MGSDLKRRTPKLIPIDLAKCFSKDGATGQHDHPDIRKGNRYLALIGTDYFAGRFTREWYGWSFDDWYGTSLQLDKPRTNGSEWRALWQIR